MRVQWLRLCVSTVGGVGMTLLSWGTKVCCMAKKRENICHNPGPEGLACIGRKTQTSL